MRSPISRFVVAGTEAGDFSSRSDEPMRSELNRPPGPPELTTWLASVYMGGQSVVCGPIAGLWKVYMWSLMFLFGNTWIQYFLKAKYFKLN